MIRVRQVIVDVTRDTREELIRKTARKVNIPVTEIKQLTVNKQSLDARKKPQLFYIYEVDITVAHEEQILRQHRNDVIPTPSMRYQFPTVSHQTFEHSIIIVGAGPAGLFSAYLLAEHGYPVMVIERGEPIEKRVQTVSQFWETGILNPESNVQFGEGGAGTFSDGKLNTLSKDPASRMRKVFEVLVACGAPKEILYSNKPHIGTDLLRDVVVKLRKKIIAMGGTFRYNTCLTDLIIKEDQLTAIEVNHQEIIATNHLVLAIGHSARDTFAMLHRHQITMHAKPFAVGVRVMHKQAMINESQYGVQKHPTLPPANYKLTYQTTSGRAVYSFCMCPGGMVVNASSEKEHLVINGMSNYHRDSPIANSAIVVSVNLADYGDDVMAGIAFQRTLEARSYQIGQGKIPVQLYRDFCCNQCSQAFGEIIPELKGDYQFANLRELLPPVICDAIQEGMTAFDRRIKGFGAGDTVLAAVESRTSSPIRIDRDQQFCASIKGIYPSGEGAGYAGGITTSAMDGIRVAEAIALGHDPRKKTSSL